MARVDVVDLWSVNALSVVTIGSEYVVERRVGPYFGICRRYMGEERFLEDAPDGAIDLADDVGFAVPVLDDDIV